MEVKIKKEFLKCGIIGCGNIAGGYDSPNNKKIRTHAHAFLKNKSCNLFSSCDLSLNKAKKFSLIWGGNYYYDNIDDFAKDNLDIVSICTPTITHLEIFEKIAKYSPKIVWIEKPSSNSYQEIKKMIKISKNNFEVWVNYFRKHIKEYINVKNELKVIGKIQYVSCYYTKGFQHNGSHIIDLMIFFFGRILSFKVINQFKRDKFLDVDLTLVTKKTEIFIKSLDYRNFELFEIDIIGSKGRIIITERGSNINIFRVKNSDEYKGYKILKENITKKNILDNAMSENLSFGLLGKRKNELQADLEVQQLVSKVINNIG